ncbi:YphA family membrane protein [Salibacterium aidingense]|uniref:YphA family membrane protein n=1 Tax=Salibacterium aidingense TaxID=384933 RepID=UPI00047EC363|nr:hypothetical protein [Salibacterium aidingense]
MSGIIYFSILWYLWIIQTFFAPKDTFRLVSAIFILSLIILYPLEWNQRFVTLKPAFVLFYGGGWVLLASVNKRKQWTLVSLAAALSFLFAALRLAEWYEPVVFLFGQTLTYVVLFSILFLVFAKTLRERAALALITCLSGEIITQIHLFPWTQLVQAGDYFVLDTVVLILFILHLHHLSAKAANVVFSRHSASSAHLPQ